MNPGVICGLTIYTFYIGWIEDTFLPTRFESSHNTLLHLRVPSKDGSQHHETDNLYECSRKFGKTSGQLGLLTIQLGICPDGLGGELRQGGVCALAHLADFSKFLQFFFEVTSQLALCQLGCPSQARRLRDASSFGPAPLRCAVRLRPCCRTGRCRPVARWHGGSAVAAPERCQVVSICRFSGNGQKWRSMGIRVHNNQGNKKAREAWMFVFKCSSSCPKRVKRQLSLVSGFRTLK